MTFNAYVETFAGLPIREYQPGEAITEQNVAHRVALSADDYYNDGLENAKEEFYAYRK